MTIAQDISLIVTLSQVFFANNPTVTEIEAFLPQIATAVASAKTGAAFSAAFPLKVNGVAGTASIGWSPT